MTTTIRVSPNRWVFFGKGREKETALRFWFIEDAVPFRVGTGWRIRGPRDVRLYVGSCRRTSATTTEEALGGSVLEVEPSEIREWHGPSNQQAEPTSVTGQGEGTAPQAP